MKINKMKGLMDEYLGEKVNITAEVFALLNSPTKMKTDKIVLKNVTSESGELLCKKMWIRRDDSFVNVRRLEKGDIISISEVKPFIYDSHIRKPHRLSFLKFGIDYMSTDLSIIKKTERVPSRVDSRYYKYIFCNKFLGEKSYISPKQLLEIFNWLDEMNEEIESFTSECIRNYVKHGWKKTKIVTINTQGELTLKDGVRAERDEVELYKLRNDLKAHPYLIEDYLKYLKENNLVETEDVKHQWLTLSYENEAKQEILEGCIDELKDIYMRSIDWKYKRIYSELKFKSLVK